MLAGGSGANHLLGVLGMWGGEHHGLYVPVVGHQLGKTTFRGKIIDGQR